MKRIVYLFSLLFLVACATENPLKSLRFHPISTSEYTIASWFKIKKPTQPLKVYIEGDGHAFNRRGYPTQDPTPQGLFLRKLAVDDTSPNVVYLARPCQYLMGKTCTQKDWTSGRFSPQIISSMEASVGALMKKARAQKVILIGYSGGAMIASQIAVRHPQEVQKLITIAGVLDKDKWAEYHHDAPLVDSLNLNIDQLQGIPQVHYIGSDDKIVPPELAYNVLGTKNPTIKIVEDATHNKGYEEIYIDIWKER